MISHDAEISLCASDELVIAACHFSDKKSKILSFCVSLDKRSVRYRFGFSSNVAMDYVFSSGAPLSRWVAAATYTVYLGFRLGRYSYAFGVPQETLGAKAFLELAKDNKLLMSFECAGNSFGDERIGSKAIKEVADEFVRSKNFIFPPD